MDALAALGREERDDVVARRDERHARADALDDAGPLVPEHARRVAGRIGAGGRVEVGVAHAARREPDEHLAVLRLSEVELLDDERLPELLEDCGADLHAAEANPKRTVEGFRSSVRVDGTPMIWPVAALAALFLLCFVVVYGTRLQARVESGRDTHA